MRLNNCPICERHVRPDETECPFCHAGLELQTAAGSRAMLVAALGLTLAACASDDTTTETMGGSMSAGTMTTTNDTEPGTGTSDTGTTTPDPTIDSGGQEYAGPGISTGEISTTSSGGETDTETDTDATTTGGATDSGGQDYAGSAVVEEPEQR